MDFGNLVRSPGLVLIAFMNLYPGVRDKYASYLCPSWFFISKSETNETAVAYCSDS